MKASLIEVKEVGVVTLLSNLLKSRHAPVAGKVENASGCSHEEVEGLRVWLVPWGISLT